MTVHVPCSHHIFCWKKHQKTFYALNNSIIQKVSMTPTSIWCIRVTNTGTISNLISFMIFSVIVVNQIRHNNSLTIRFAATALSSSSSLSSNSRMVASVASTSTSTSNNNNKGKPKLIFHWFRNGDLRLHDNPALTHSVKLATTTVAGTASNPAIILPIYCFDDTKLFGTSILTPNDDLKCSPKRAKFMIECINDLQCNLRKECNTQLIIGKGNPTTIFTNIIEILGPKEYEYTIVIQDEVCKEEKDVAKSVMTAVKALTGKINFQSIWGSTMYELKDLPYDTKNNLQDMPDVFTPFRTKVEKVCKIPRPLSIPTKSEMSSKLLSIKGTSAYTAIENVFSKYSTIPTLADLGYTTEQIEYANNYDTRGVMKFIGGENAGLERIKDYIWTLDCIKDYFDTRNGMIGPNYSTKFAPWLAHGCISSRYIVSEIQKYEKQRIENKSTYWVIFELLWRDYCKFFAVKYGNEIFYPGGTIGKNPQWKYYDKSIIAWKTGQTGYPLVDANMRELAATGFMSNRGRQNVASFLAIDLNQDWRIGGDHFESLLLDYDVYSNWVVRLFI
jgi:deoxyribodipyrimidine photo-lyase